MLLVSVISGIMLYIIYQNRNTGIRVDTLMETELATRITAEDVEEIVDLKLREKMQDQKNLENNNKEKETKICEPENQALDIASPETRD